MKSSLCLILIFTILFFASCNENNDSIPECSASNPMEELEWLKDFKNSLTNCSCQISIIQGKYQNKTVFYSLMNDPLCNSAFNIVLLDCEGNLIKEYKQGQNEIFANEVKPVTTLYTCKD